MICGGLDATQSSCLVHHVVQRFPDVFERGGITNDALTYLQAAAQIGC